MKHFKPGNKVRFTNVILNPQGVLSDPAQLVVILFLPDKTQTTATPTRDSQGMYHVDILIPFATPPGVAVHRWIDASLPASADALAEQRFYVDRLAF